MKSVHDFLINKLNRCYCIVERNLKYFKSLLTKEEIQDLEDKIQKAKREKENWNAN